MHTYTASHKHTRQHSHVILSDELLGLLARLAPILQRKARELQRTQRQDSLLGHDATTRWPDCRVSSELGEKEDDSARRMHSGCLVQRYLVGKHEKHSRSSVLESRRRTPSIALHVATTSQRIDKAFRPTRVLQDNKFVLEVAATCRVESRCRFLVRMSVRTSHRLKAIDGTHQVFANGCELTLRVREDALD